MAKRFRNNIAVANLEQNNFAEITEKKLCRIYGLKLRRTRNLPTVQERGREFLFTFPHLCSPICVFYNFTKDIEPSYFVKKYSFIIPSKGGVLNESKSHKDEKRSQSLSYIK